MSEIKLYFTDGTYMGMDNQPQATIDNILEWYRDAPEYRVLSLNTHDGDFHIQKRHITRIVVQ